jgi:hypothetical protein
MTKSELFIFAHKITKYKNIAYFGSYQKAFGHVLRELYAKGYQHSVAVNAAEIETDGRIAK